ncbi:MAG: pseudouridine-5-phosphate glycosidase [Sulfobacillus acidophilus]|uniref:Pseudouridine-5'-phosphate glycosidase n=1 Tax=Sulfobacillus acidophilus TaxID=53633 RepID=A0A2T2WIY1_9FIRM|nr:MAG: pseudouridine-5-phosphate glycosidase [Sulfobacillus acidophilus]
MISDEVQVALSSKAPVVALETAVLTHGLPFPDNLETMRKMDGAVRKYGAVPAVVAIRQGQIVVGLEAREWESLLEGAEKCSIRDLGAIVARGQNGGTTVAATAYLAQRAGIRVFATGGIGGVHRGWETSLDVSADLYVLSRCAMTVVCSGAKSILDIPKTLEMLESLGIPVIGYQTDHMPGFYVADTGLNISTRLENVRDVAMMERTMRQLDLSQALLVVQPGPRSVDGAVVEALIAEALKEARAQFVSGKDATPFLLGYLNQRAGAQLKAANIALLEQNASLAAQIAGAFSAV